MVHQEAGVMASKWTMTPRRERRGAGAVAVGGPGEPGPGDYDLEVWLGSGTAGAQKLKPKHKEFLGGEGWFGVIFFGEHFEGSWRIPWLCWLWVVLIFGVQQQREVNGFLGSWFFSQCCLLGIQVFFVLLWYWLHFYSMQWGCSIFPYAIELFLPVFTWKFVLTSWRGTQETFGKSAKYTAGQKFAWGPKLSFLKKTPTAITSLVMKGLDTVRDHTTLFHRNPDSYI